MERTILLNSDFTFLNTISWKRAVCLMIKNKVEVITETSQRIATVDSGFEIFVPKVLRLLHLVRTVYTRKAAFTPKNLLVRDKHTCQYCGNKSKKLTIEHVIPQSRGGKTNFENCVIACESCNSRKGNKTPREARMPLKSRPYQPMIIELIYKRMKHLGLDTVLADLVM
jgi:5-methylcytosine-specific restriction endonuclease McrA